MNTQRNTPNKNCAQLIQYPIQKYNYLLTDFLCIRKNIWVPRSYICSCSPCSPPLTLHVHSEPLLAQPQTLPTDSREPHAHCPPPPTHPRVTAQPVDQILPRLCGDVLARVTLQGSISWDGLSQGSQLVTERRHPGTKRVMTESSCPCIRRAVLWERAGRRAVKR